MSNNPTNTLFVEGNNRICTKEDAFTIYTRLDDIGRKVDLIWDNLESLNNKINILLNQKAVKNYKESVANDNKEGKHDPDQSLQKIVIDCPASNGLKQLRVSDFLTD